MLLAIRLFPLDYRDRNRESVPLSGFSTLLFLVAATYHWYVVTGSERQKRPCEKRTRGRRYWPLSCAPRVLRGAAANSANQWENSNSFQWKLINELDNGCDSWSTATEPKGRERKGRGRRRKGKEKRRKKKSFFFVRGGASSDVCEWRVDSKAKDITSSRIEAPEAAEFRESFPGRVCGRVGTKKWKEEGKEKRRKNRGDFLPIVSVWRCAYGVVVSVCLSWIVRSRSVGRGTVKRSCGCAGWG